MILSVVVCTYNRESLLVKCLQSLADQTLAKNQYEVLVIDNNSTDGTQDLINKYIDQNDNFYSYIEYEQGHSQARNRGYKEAKGKYIAYIDDDAIATPEWCENILNAFETTKPTPAAVGGSIHPYYEEKKPDWFLDEFEIREWGDHAHFLEFPRAQYGFSGSNMAFSRELLDKYRGFSSDYGIVNGNLRMGEDTEFFYRIYKEHPYFWYDPRIRVTHWTPNRNMKFSYIFKRSKNGAIANYLINFSGCRVNRYKNSLDIIKKILHLLISGVIYVKTLFMAQEHWKTTTFKYMAEWGARIGEINVRIRRLFL